VVEEVEDLPGIQADRLLMLLKQQQQKVAKKPRSLSSKDPHGEITAVDLEAEAAKKRDQELEKMQEWVAYRGEEAIATGHLFTIGPQISLLQKTPIHQPGSYKIKVALSQEREPVWNPRHEVFCGARWSMPNRPTDVKFFGYVVGLSDFQGIYRVQSASSEGAVGEPQCLTGSGKRVEFDLQLDVEMERINQTVGCKVAVILNNVTFTEDQFSVHKSVLAGTGMRLQVIGTGISRGSEVEASIQWAT